MSEAGPQCAWEDCPATETFEVDVFTGSSVTVDLCEKHHEQAIREGYA